MAERQLDTTIASQTRSLGSRRTISGRSLSAVDFSRCRERRWSVLGKLRPGTALFGFCKSVKLHSVMELYSTNSVSVDQLLVRACILVLA